MNKPPDNKTARRPLIAELGLAIALLLAVVFLSTWWLLRSAQKTTEGAVYDVSELYLEELTAHKAQQFTQTLDSQIQQVLVTVRALRESDVDSQEALQAFIGDMKERNDFDFFAFVDDRGTVYTRDAAFPGISKFTFLGRKFTQPVVSFDQSMGTNNLVLICVPLEDEFLVQQGLFAVMVGLNTDTVAERLALDQTGGQSFSNVVMSNGSYIIRTEHAHISANSNLFSTLEKEADFAGEGDLARWREDMDNGRPGMVSYALQDMIHYTYYMPIGGTDWFITTTLHYDLISGNVDIIRTTLTRNSIAQLVLILLVIFALSSAYLMVRRRNENLRFEKIQAEENSKAKSVFLSNMSHDIRTPMNAIIGFTNLAMKNVEDVDRTKDYLGKILVSSNHLLTLINDVLEMSRIESGKIRLEETECNLSELLRDLNSIIQGQIQSKRLDLSMELVDVDNEDVYCDKLRINQVFLNLLGNAVKFTPEGGKISVRIQQTAGAPEGCGAYVIRVKDTGIGMTPEFAKKVFTPFERERTSTVSKIQGTGLGMSITKNIIDLMGGAIDVVTAPGEGTEFVIRVNLRVQEKQPTRLSQSEEAGVQAPAPEQGQNAQADFAGKRILLTEDNELNREIAVEILTEAGFEMDTAEDGSVAVEKVRASAPGYYDLILMDIQMPIMNGYEATHAIRTLEDSALASIPIIAMTANAFEEDKKAALDAGMNGHLAKPLDTEKLFAVLAELVGK